MNSSSTTPLLPTSEPPKIVACQNWGHFVVSESDLEVSQLLDDGSHPDQNLSTNDQVSRLRLDTDFQIENQPTEAAGDGNLLQPAKVPKRRRSPVTVQEWVASLPVPHLLNRTR